MSNEKFIINSDDKKLVGLKQEGYTRDVNHKYIKFSDKPPSGFISQAAALLTNHYLKEVKQSINKWKADKQLYNVAWLHPKTKKELKSTHVSYLIFAKTLREYEFFDSEKFNLPPIECFWLHKTIDVSINFHYFDKGGSHAVTIEDGTPQEQYGDKYPIKPKIDREGHIFTTFQPQLINRIIRERKSLIENSDKCLKPEWILDLRALINDSISLLDITLNQLYIKAEYAPEPEWTFDTNKIGQKNNRRIRDKLKWIRQITGNPLNIEAEFPKLNGLRILRNHLNHFDPPTLVITLEEAVGWLNDILYIGQILIKIREAVGVSVSTSLINLIIQKEAVFNPEEAFKNRLPLIKAESGYTTSIWKAIEDEDE
jgi:hypothetical protein